MTQQTKNAMPVHIGIIMDGNGRWAKKRGLPRKAGHKQGAEALKKISDYCLKIGIKYLTVYAFSTENWSRPKDEVDSIIDLLRSFFKEVSNYSDKNAKINFIGDINPLPDDIKQSIEKIQNDTAHNNGFVMNIAFNYGGRNEIVNAVKKIAAMVANNELQADSITEETISNNIYTCGQPDPDLIIRPSGEYRLSNFLLWQSAYSELVFMNVLWPDFTTDNLDSAIEQYRLRNRRFGGI
ncbi:MAG TPA: isoprenyl transferase [Ruminococcaceae bacterium]|nr:isoprenyl transferase [Oscillospiraceae bacterium]